jgi:hypothetical protein
MIFEFELQDLITKKTWDDRLFKQLLIQKRCSSLFEENPANLIQALI